MQATVSLAQSALMCYSSMPAPVGNALPSVRVGPSDVHGRGVYAIQFISRGTRIVEYAGQRVSWDDTLKDENNPHTFIFGLENGEVINPEMGGNESRWINHCCNLNCEAIEEDDSDLHLCDA